jgi:hypothetical protein
MKTLKIKTLTIAVLLGGATVFCRGETYQLGGPPQELPAIIVTGYVEDDYGYLWNNLVWTSPTNSYGSQNMKGLRYISYITYGRMRSAPALLHGPYHNLGNPGRYLTATVRVDTDGDPNENGYDPHWNPGTSLPGLNSAVTPYVAYTDASVAAGVGPGDWAQILNPLNGNWIWAVCGDYSDGHPEGEISEAACWLMGWPFYQNSATMYENHVTIKYFPHSRGL